MIDTLISIRGDLPLPKRMRETVQSRLNHYTSQSSVFTNRGGPLADDLFYSPGGKRSGTWAVRHDVARTWLIGRDVPLP